MTNASRAGERIRASQVAMAILALAGAPSGVRAQSYDRWSCSGFGGVVFDESEQSAYCKGYNGGICTGEYTAACQEGARARASGDESRGVQQGQAQLNEMESNRREVERLPPLAAKGNPLLGRWQRVPTNAPPPRNMYESLMSLGNEVACGAISGEGPNFEFRADALVHGTQTMDAMRYYRGRNGVVVALGERYRPPLAFEFDGPNRTTLGGCAFERVDVVATASAPERASTGAALAVPSTKASAATATTANKSASGAISILNVQLGVDSYASIEREIAARGGIPLPGADSGKYWLSSMSGDYRDGGPAVTSVHYVFNGPGPAGKLISLAIVNHGSAGPEFDKLLEERKAAAAKLFGTLQQKSATEFLAAAPSCRLRLVANPATSYIYETYELSD